MKREKVEHDPLSFFADAATNKVHHEEEEEEEEPVPEPVPEPEPQMQPAPVQKAVKSKGVKFSEPDPVVEEPKRNKSVEQPSVPPQKPHETIDELFSSEYNRKTDQLLAATADDIFSEENSPFSTKSSGKIDTSILKGAIDYKKTDDDDISDLKVSMLLEREDGLDQSIFGHTNAITQKIVQKKKKHNTELDNEQDFLKELDEITINNPKFASSMSRSNDSQTDKNAKVSTSTTQEKKKDIDLNSFDINSYITEESSTSGGGLFD
jgi:hypothetical protein